MQYSLDPSQLGNAFVHITNVAVQKHSEHYDPDSGCKWDLRGLKLQMARKHGLEAVDMAFMEVQQVIIRTLQAVQPVMNSDRHSFELYGFDIMFTDELKPFIIECNSSPSMSAETPADYHLKSVLLNETLTLAELNFAGGELPVTFGGFDMIFNEAAPSSLRFGTPCRLGWFTPSVHGKESGSP